jgi:hypothetical protein
MSVPLWPFVALVVFGVAVYKAMRSATEHKRLRRELVNSPPLSLGSPDGGVVRFTGVVRPIELLTAPLTGRPCVMYCSRVDNVAVLGPKAWDVRIAASITPFVLEGDDGAKVRIDGQAIVELPETRANDADRKRQFLVANGVTAEQGGRPRFREILVEPGMRVSIVGQLSRDPSSEPSTVERGFRADQPPVVRLVGNPTHPLVIGHALESSPA